MTRKDKRSLMAAKIKIDVAYDYVAEVQGRMEAEGKSDAAEKLEDIMRELSEQQTYIDQVIEADE